MNSFNDHLKSRHIFGAGDNTTLHVRFEREICPWFALKISPKSLISFLGIIFFLCGSGILMGIL